MRSKKQKEYAKYLKSKHWLEIREEVLKRDNYKCILCENEEDIQVHHKTYDRLGEEKLSDLLTLCGNCHLLYHITNYYYYIMPDKYNIDDDPIYLDTITFNKIKNILNLIRA